MTLSTQKILAFHILLMGASLCTILFPLQANALEGVSFHLNTSIESLTAEVLLLTPTSTPLNSFQTTVFFDPTVLSVAYVEPVSALCEDRFIIHNIVDNEAGIVYLECGTALPFTGTSTPILSIQFNETSSDLASIEFGNRNIVAKHDGFGTYIKPFLLQ